MQERRENDSFLTGRKNPNVPLIWLDTNEVSVLFVSNVIFLTFEKSLPPSCKVSEDGRICRNVRSLPQGIYAHIFMGTGGKCRIKQW